jgi:hypothetical protein
LTFCCHLLTDPLITVGLTVGQVVTKQFATYPPTF